MKKERIEKKRLTHDQPFLGIISQKSMNSQVIHEELELMTYRFIFLRCLHMIHLMRIASTFTPILVGKFDLETVYRIMQINAIPAVK